MLSAVAAVLGFGMGLGMGHAPSGYEYVWGQNGVGYQYSVLTPIFVVLLTIVSFYGAVRLNVNGSGSFVAMMEYLDRAEGPRRRAWVVAYRVLNTCAFIEGGLLAVAIVSSWLSRS